MEYLLIGKCVGTHGLKGEIKIISDYKYKHNIFIKGMTLYIGDNKESFIINTYRPHKSYDMITLEGINNIEQIIKYKGDLVYINIEDLKIDKTIFTINDLINYDVFVNNKEIGKVIEIMHGKANDIIVVSESRILIPYIDEFVLNVDNDNKKINIKAVKGLTE